MCDEGENNLSARKLDINGWYEIEGNPLSKTGVYPYKGSSIDPAGELGLNPEKIYQVYRPAEELADPECIKSFCLVPWIDDHEMMGGEMTPAESKGINGVIGEKVYFDESDQMLKANIKIFSENMKQLIDHGKEELSAGYRCKYVLESGIFDGESYSVVQRHIRGNHLALVDEGRMGPDVAVLDGSERFCFTIDSKDLIMPEEKAADQETDNMTLAQVVETLKALTEAVANMQPADEEAPETPMDEEEEKAADMEEEEKAADMEEEEDEEEEKAAEDEEEVKDSKDVGMDASGRKLNRRLKKQVAKLQSTVDSLVTDGTKSVLRQLSKRDALANQLSRFVGVFDHSEMTTGDVARYGIKKLGIKCNKGREMDVLTGFMHSRSRPTTGYAIDAKSNSNTIDEYLKGEV